MVKRCYDITTRKIQQKFNLWLLLRLHGRTTELIPPLLALSSTT
jgi:hypothetical protein